MGVASSATLEVSSGAIWFGGTACGAATTTNTDTINVTGHVGTVEDLVVSMLGGEFAPGATAEASPNLSEIEINVNLGDTTDELTVAGTSGDDTIRLGQSGVNLNADSDRDISFAQVPNEVTIYGGSGVNTLSAKGGFGSGTIYVGKAVIINGDGGGVVQGGSGNDELNGGAGQDQIEGQNGDDTINGGAGNDNLLGQGGNDTITGGPGADEFLGATGNDTMHAEDDEADTSINGGSDVDTAYFDLGLDPDPAATETEIPS
jgi:Ca2+-binding RTX toxin-like protein